MHTKSSLIIVLCCCTSSAVAAVGSGSQSIFDFSTTEFHYQHGNNFQRAFSPEPAQKATIYTLQHVNGWKYGDNFFFVDVIDANDTGSDVYTEVYANFSFGKMLGQSVGVGLMQDVGLIAGLNYAKNAKVYKYLPGVRLSWDLPSFAFLNTDFTAYIDDSRGVSGGGAPAESDSYMIDVSWSFPFSVGEHDFGIEGHIEYIGGRHNEFGEKVNYHILAQPQLRYDLGKALFHKTELIFVGIEYQLWINKMGGNKNDNVVQALVVLRF